MKHHSNRNLKNIMVISTSANYLVHWFVALKLRMLITALPNGLFSVQKSTSFPGSLSKTVSGFGFYMIWRIMQFSECVFRLDG